MTKSIITTLLLLLPLLATAQNILYGQSDSTTIERILKKHSAITYDSQGELIMALAKEFIGKRYIPNTLDKGKDEPLFISCDSLDCSTFVELVTAIAMSIARHEPTFAATCSNLEKIRYRNGKRNGYDSRLHYTSWWIADNAARGIIEEVTTKTEHKQQHLNLNFMSSHPGSYAMLKEDTAMQTKIAELEKPFRDITVPYIPKQMLSMGQKTLKIENGDIVALVTTIEGLDVSHVGFALWIGENLHLVHASSSKGEVIIDPATLYVYQQKKKRQIGIRVLRLQQQGEQ